MLGKKQIFTILIAVLIIGAIAYLYNQKSKADKAKSISDLFSGLGNVDTSYNPGNTPAPPKDDWTQWLSYLG